jgi:hypothetical protein
MVGLFWCTAMGWDSLIVGLLLGLIFGLFWCTATGWDCLFGYYWHCLTVGLFRLYHIQSLANVTFVAFIVYVRW